MRTGDGDASPQAHQLSKHLCARYDGNFSLTGRRDFGIVRMHRRRYDHGIGARNIRSGMADGNTDTDARQTTRRRTVGQIRTADGKAQIGEHFRDTAHPGTADSYKMNVFNLMPHAVLRRRWPV